MIIGFTGKLGSGKDTAGERMATMVDLPSRRVSFAAPLKESAAALLDIPVEDWETYKNDPEAKIFLTVGYKPVLFTFDYESGAFTQTEELEEPNIIREFTAREFLQRYGTESHRDIFGQDFWADVALNTLRFTSAHEFVYMTDVRFENEAKALMSVGGRIIRVHGIEEETGGHASERGLSDEYIWFGVDNSVRDDGYANLDNQLATIARICGLPLKESVLL